MQIKLTNPLQEDILERFRAELMGHLRKTLNNSGIKLSYEYAQDNEKKMLYTPLEKFSYLTDKQPVLKELQRRFMLDTDF